MMTREDNLFTVADNSVRKDRLTGQPYFAASSWKGCFRATLHQLGHDSRSVRDVQDRIWGKASGNDIAGEEEAQAGRLQFFSTYFDRLDFRMLNPQSRVKRSGTVPIELEVVPEGALGRFQLLYVPFFVSPESHWRSEADEDWRLISQVVSQMLLRFGFGAKQSLGFGAAKDEVSNGAMLARGSNAGGWKRSSVTKISLLPGLKLPWS
jgi:CRISPR-associated protein Cmr2